MMQSLGTTGTESLVVHVEALLEELVPGYLEDRKKDVEAIVAACGHGDYDTLWVLGHDMKGSRGGYGFDPISDIGRSLEHSASEQNLEEVRNLVGELAIYQSM